MFWNWTRRPLGKDFARGWKDTTRGGENDGPRVLFESPDGAEAHAAWKLLQRHGYRVTWCPGPHGGFSPECALSTTGHCTLVDEADVVVSALDLRDASSQEVVARAAGGLAHPGRRGDATQRGAQVGRGAPRLHRRVRAAQLQGAAPFGEPGPPDHAGGGGPLIPVC